MAFSNSAVVNYPVEEIFSVFIKTAKRDFPKFDESNPIGAAIIKKVGPKSSKAAILKIEITDYKKNELYKIMTTSTNAIYYSTYQFEKIDENSTNITLIEDNETQGIFTKINSFLQYASFKGKVNRRFIRFIEALEREIENFREKLEKNSKSRAEEEQKINEKADAKKAKEIALLAEKKAKKARLEAKTVLEETDIIEETEIVESDIEEKESVEE